LHGCWLSLERMFRSSEESSGFRPAGWLVTMIVVGLSWLLFRARNLTQALTMLTDLRVLEWRSSFAPVLAYLAIIASLTLVIDLRLELWKEEYPFEKARVPLAIATASLFGVLMTVFGPMEMNAFIYFQF
jgi:hypothetical protein